MDVGRPGRSWRAVDEAIDGGIRDGVYPGAVVIVGRADTVLYVHHYGHFTWRTTSPMPDAITTRWDLASLTKVVATTAAAAILVQQHRLDLDAPVQRYLPGFIGAHKSAVTVRMLLNHTSGMPPFVRLSSVAKTPAQARAALLTVPLSRTPDDTSVYSDLNAMLAGMVVERVTGKPLNVFADSAVFTPLGMKSTAYLPDALAQSHAAPTGHYHSTPLAGTVNDPNANTLGGVSGNAGLFSTGFDLARFAQAWLRAAHGRSRWLSREVAREFLSHTPHAGTRVLGWDTPDPPGSPKPTLYGTCATPTTFGHTGWTGTEIWIDTEQNLFVVFLTNRSYAPRNPEASFLQLKQVRIAVADAARRAAGGCG